jgi:prepilin-type N-terminal cleavage/methylation domain-containing protein
MRRQGFTLVEMMVTTAMVLLIMVILTQAFSNGLQIFRDLKAVGDLEQRLRTASTIMHRDLAADHFEGRRRLSDPNFWQLGPPREGYVFISGGASNSSGLFDGDGVPFLFATGHIIQLTTKLRGNSRGDYYTATVPDNTLTSMDPFPADSRYQDSQGTTFNSQWAEVAYFMAKNGRTTGGSNPQTLFALFRRQRLAVSSNDQINWTSPLGVASQSSYPGVSCIPNPTNAKNLYFNNQSDLTVPTRRFGLNSSVPYTPLGTGEDLLLTDVLSFVVQILPSNTINTDFIDVPTNSQGNTQFDSWSTLNDGAGDNVWSTAPPQSYGITAIRITLRIWDVRSGQTRQITVVENM